MTKVEQQCCPDFELRQQSVFQEYSAQMTNLILTQCHFADVRFPRTKKLDGGTNDAAAVSGQDKSSCAGLDGLRRQGRRYERNHHFGIYAGGPNPRTRKNDRPPFIGNSIPLPPFGYSRGFGADFDGHFLAGGPKTDN